MDPRESILIGLRVVFMGRPIEADENIGGCGRSAIEVGIELVGVAGMLRP